MRKTCVLALLVLLPASATASEDAEDWRLIGGALSLVQQIVSLAANSPDPQAAQKGVDAMLSGENANANRLASGLVNEILLDVPTEYRGTFLSIGRDLLTLARREQAKAAAAPSLAPGSAAAPAVAPAPMDAIQARKELHAMGLRYWDEQQFLEAVRRGDRIAVDLYVAARGLQSTEPRNPPPAR